MSTQPIAALHGRLRIHARSSDEPLDTIEDACAHCLQKWQAAFEAAKNEGHNSATARRVAAMAYKISMPSLTGIDAIKAHIACVAQGVTLEVFNGRDGSQLLYAAQVALSIWKAAN